MRCGRVAQHTCARPDAPLVGVAPIRTTSKQTMGFSFKRYLVAVDDTLYRLANTTFDRMLRDPANHRFPVFAGQRVRMADVVVELVGREPACVVRATFAVLTFDDEGRLDASKFGKQQFALAETALAPVFAVPDSNETVVDATHRFVAQGGAWAPSKPLARAIDDAALGRRKCPRLGTV